MVGDIRRKPFCVLAGGHRLNGRMGFLQLLLPKSMGLYRCLGWRLWLRKPGSIQGGGVGTVTSVLYT